MPNNSVLSKTIRPRRMALVYVVASSIWIGVSDLILSGFGGFAWIGIAKGLLFVAVTGLLLYILLHRMQVGLERSELTLQSTLDRFRWLVEAAPEGIFFQVNGRFQYVNPAALRVFGASHRNQIEGTPILARVRRDAESKVRERLRELRETQVPNVAIEVPLIRLDGSEFEAELLVVRAEVDAEQGELVFLRDSTERNRAHAEHSRLESQVRQAQKMESIGRLAGAVAHDFNNYLTVINGYSQLLLAKLEAGNPIRQPIDQIRLAGERAGALTRQLLSFSRRDDAEMVVFDLNASLRGLEKILGRLVGEQVRLDMELCPGECKISADSGWISQVVMNLVVNSRDAMPDGGRILVRTSVVRFDAETEPNEAHRGVFALIEVVDNGFGMDEETRKHIFEPFYTTKKPGEGTGLGLSTVYSIVKRCAGWIEVISQPGEGCCFQIHLPLQRQVAPVAVEQQPLPPVVAAGGTIVLLAEDQDEVREFLATSLRSCGYTVLAATGGEDALRVSSQFSGHIHLLLTDVVMPGLSGPELAKRLQHLRPETKVMFMSGYAAGLMNKETAGFPFLPKPIETGTLARRLHEAIKGG